MPDQLTSFCLVSLYCHRQCHVTPCPCSPISAVELLPFLRVELQGNLRKVKVLQNGLVHKDEETRDKHP
jgi:hypothetical protein